MLKKVKLPLLLSAFLVLLTACGTDENAGKENSEKVEHAEHQKQETEVEKVTKDLYAALVNKEVEKVGTFFSKKQLELNKTTADKFGELFFTTPEKAARAYKGYEIKEIKAYDDTKTYVLVSDKIEVNGEVVEELSSMMAVKEDGTWKFQYDTALGEPIALNPLTSEGDWITFDKITYTELIDGLTVNAVINNNSSVLGYPNTMHFGYGDTVTTAYLLTTDGVFERPFEAPIVIDIDGNLTTTIGFHKATGKPLGISLSNVYAGYELDENGNPAEGYGPHFTGYFLEELTNERATEIAEGVFKDLAQVDVAKTEEEAYKILDKVFETRDSYLAEGIKSNLEFGKYEKVNVEFVSSDASYDDVYGNIVHDAEIKLTLTDKNGKETVEEFYLTTNIMVSAVNGQYVYSAFAIE